MESNEYIVYPHKCHESSVPITFLIICLGVKYREK